MIHSESVYDSQQQKRRLTKQKMDRTTPLKKGLDGLYSVVADAAADDDYDEDGQW